ncbi:hypothetical protein O3P69_017963 [Scylla paramamosain]|uniref:Uncharacterized protein n=1 Tax=Scylla paramamosain TaxID=85552 RepID=A0AAW0THR7_SCYPA
MGRARSRFTCVYEYKKWTASGVVTLSGQVHAAATPSTSTTTTAAAAAAATRQLIRVVYIAQLIARIVPFALPAAGDTKGLPVWCFLSWPL